MTKDITAPPTDALQKARELRAFQKEYNASKEEIDDNGVELLNFFNRLQKAFPSIHAELEKVTQHREELLAMVKSIGKGALVHSEANKVLTAERDELLKGYSKALEFIRIVATGCRADGTYNYSRKALEQKAKDIITSFSEIK